MYSRPLVCCEKHIKGFFMPFDMLSVENKTRKGEMNHEHYIKRRKCKIL